MTIYEQAREAVYRARFPNASTDAWSTASGGFREEIELIADAASDVWASLLRDLLADVEFIGVPFSLTGQAGYQRAKAALEDVR